ncbi:MAG: hypothetical protein WCQ70_08875, partial [Lentimicrobiaceae bacterium]
EPFVVIAGKNRVHDDFIVVLQLHDLAFGDSAVRGSEQVRLDEFAAMPHIVQIRLLLRLPSFEVVERMVAGGVAVGKHHFIYIRVLAHILAHAEKSGLYPVTVQYFEYTRGNFRYGSVIKSEVNSMLAFSPPYQLCRHQQPDQPWNNR